MKTSSKFITTPNCAFLRDQIAGVMSSAGDSYARVYLIGGGVFEIFKPDAADLIRQLGGETPEPQEVKVPWGGIAHVEKLGEACNVGEFYDLTSGIKRGTPICFETKGPIEVFRKIDHTTSCLILR